MAKGFKLKELLTHQKEQAKVDKQEAEKQTRKNEILKTDEVTTVTAEDLAIATARKEAEAKISKKESEPEYKSQTLSKKEQRKLKKELKKTKEEESDNESENEQEQNLDLDRLAESASEEDDDEEGEEDDEEGEEEEEKEEDVPLSEVEFDSDADIVPHQKLTINNTKAMNHALERIQLPWAKHSFQEHQSITSKENCDESIKDIYDDTERELAFYKQSLDAVLEARDHFKRLKIPFKRPLDYFAEMVKNDEHMDRIKSKLVQEASEKKAREDARKQRQLKKFGKQVQVATLQKRQLEKKDTLDKIKSLKKKRKQSEIGNDEFNVGIEEASTERDGYGADNKRNKPNGKREAKNTKYGFGGMKRFKRKNDADSSNDVSGFSQQKQRGKPFRPGKSKRSRRH
ncbi:hypothetical protein TPHA_0A02750 [Tetrapisispora phaffii CBS 4417]|uniref:Uncharacterized protein n=1 Tax=Tetrapisispora phaffii (strain ATCC 24235 / CBS 4417 / NBRC 1672 / NRRL Y-8282 / UCD 70-5) TaxID=1071381 RepID=G8BN79_TETPH|nr:hypothetical protein TPHA_0A02750 [Tetrapisispora phaffii CBS 4417]CCE61357.1 hypothetical protein TPHA_0A02750 [Tetrapisispora phaffii CBS 4417]